MELLPESRQTPTCPYCRKDASGAGTSCPACGTPYHVHCLNQLGGLCPDCVPRPEPTRRSPLMTWLHARHRPSGYCYWGEGERYTILIRALLLGLILAGVGWTVVHFPELEENLRSWQGQVVLGSYLAASVLLRLRWSDDGVGEPTPGEEDLAGLGASLLPGQFVVDTCWDTLLLLRYAGQLDPRQISSEDDS